MSAARVVLTVFDHLPDENLPDENLPDFNLRNGDVSDARTLLVRPAMPAGYHWVPVAGVAPEDALDLLDLYIMSALYQLQNYPPAETTEAGRRKLAIVLGTSRAVMTKHYNLSYTDFIEDELAAAVISVSTVGANGKITYRTLSSRARSDILTKNLALTKEEMAVVATLLLSSLGVLPMQGYSIMMTGHHYLTERNSLSRRAFAPIEKQFWNGNPVKNWFADDIAMIQDCAWHKSGHPVKLSIKESTACDEKIAAMLREAGVGSAACRLPAMEPPLRIANSYLALMDAADPLLKMFGGCVDAAELREMFRVIKSWSRTTESVDHLPDTWPPSVETRAKALSWLWEVLAKNEVKVAYCYGFYCGFREQNQTLLAVDTLMTSYSLDKLKRQCNGSYSKGMLTYSDCNAARNKKKMEVV